MDMAGRVYRHGRWGDRRVSGTKIWVVKMYDRIRRYSRVSNLFTGGLEDLIIREAS